MIEGLGGPMAVRSSRTNGRGDGVAKTRERRARPRHEPVIRRITARVRLGETAASRAKIEKSNGIG